MRFHYLLPPVAAALLLWQLQAAPPAKAPPAGEAVRAVMTAEESLRDVPLRDIVAERLERPDGDLERRARPSLPRLGAGS